MCVFLALYLRYYYYYFGQDMKFLKTQTQISLDLRLKFLIKSHNYYLLDLLLDIELLLL